MFLLPMATTWTWTAYQYCHRCMRSLFLLHNTIILITLIHPEQAYSIVNILLPFSSRATTTLTTCRICFTMITLISHILTGFGPASSNVNLFIFSVLISSRPIQNRDLSITNMLLPSRDNNFDNALYLLHYDNNDIITLIHCSDSPYSVRIWSRFLTYESLHLPSACHFLTRVPRRQRQSGRITDKLWEQNFASYWFIVFIDLSTSLLLVTPPSESFILIIVPLNNKTMESIGRFHPSKSL